MIDLPAMFAILLKLSIYGYLNRVQSSRRLEREASRNVELMWITGRGSGVVGYNVQVAVETEHHLIVAHEVTNDGCDRAQLAAMSKEAKAILEVDQLDAVADRGYWDSEEILAYDQAGVTVTLPKSMTSGSKADGRFGKQDFVYLPEENAYRCQAGAKLRYYYSNVEHPFGTIKVRMGAVHFLLKRLPKVRGEMALHVLAYNLTRVLNILGLQPRMAALRASEQGCARVIKPVTRRILVS
jgi:hypothetical protein